MITPCPTCDGSGQIVHCNGCDQEIDRGTNRSWSQFVIRLPPPTPEKTLDACSPACLRKGLESVVASMGGHIPPKEPKAIPTKTIVTVVSTGTTSEDERESER